MKFTLEAFKEHKQARTNGGDIVSFIAHDPALREGARLIIENDGYVETRHENGRLYEDSASSRDLIEVIEPKKVMYCYAWSIDSHHGVSYSESMTIKLPPLPEPRFRRNESSDETGVWITQTVDYYTIAQVRALAAATVALNAVSLSTLTRHIQRMEEARAYPEAYIEARRALMDYLSGKTVIPADALKIASTDEAWDSKQLGADERFVRRVPTVVMSDTNKREDDLHDAVCQAVAIINVSPELARSEDGRKVSHILRTALVEYADHADH